VPPPSGPDAQHPLFRRRVDAWLAEDLDAYMECWAADMVIDLPSGRIVGKERYRKLVQAGFSWAAPVAFDVHHIATVDRASVDRGDVVLADWTIRARRRDDGIVVGWQGLSVCEFRAGQIAWWREHHLAPPAPVVLEETQAEPTEGEA
jgi:hypothetical protein